MSRIKLIDLSSRFGKLTVISLEYELKEHSSKINKQVKRAYWKCLCDCGEIVMVRGSHLRSNATTSCRNCGFQKREENRTQVSQIEQVFKRLVIDRCKKHNIEIKITALDYEKIGKENCHYCGDLPQKTNRFSSRKYVNTEDLFLNGVDRLDSNKGYTLDNCVSCCTSCNYSKHTLSENEYKDKIIKIYNHMKLKDYRKEQF